MQGWGGQMGNGSWRQKLLHVQSCRQRQTALGSVIFVKDSAVNSSSFIKAFYKTNDINQSINFFHSNSDIEQNQF